MENFGSWPFGTPLGHGKRLIKSNLPLLSHFCIFFIIKKNLQLFLCVLNNKFCREFKGRR